MHDNPETVGTNLGEQIHGLGDTFPFFTLVTRYEHATVTALDNRALAFLPIAASLCHGLDHRRSEGDPTVADGIRAVETGDRKSESG